MKIKKLLILLVLLTVTGLAFAQLKVVIIDMEKVRNETKIGKELTTRLENLRKAKEADLKAKADEIRDTQKRLQEGSNILTDAKKLELKQKDEKLQLEYKEMLQRSQQEIYSMQQQVLKEYNDALMPILKKLSTDKGYNIVLRSDVVIYADDSNNVTDEFIKLVNAAPAKQPTK